MLSKPLPIKSGRSSLAFLSPSKSPGRLCAIPDCFYDRLFNIDQSDLSLSVQTSCFPASPAFKCRPSAWGQFGHSKSASGSMRSGLIGGCSSIAGVAFGTIFFLIGDPQPGQSCGFPVSRNFSPLIVGPTFAFMRSRPLLAGLDRSSQNHFSARPGENDSAISGVMRLAVALSWGTDLFLNGRPFPR
jgi:hypothetical protein